MRRRDRSRRYVADELRPLELRRRADTGNGSTLRRAFDAFAPYVTDPSDWSYNADGERIDSGRMEQACSASELAHAAFDDYDAQLESPARTSGRPHRDRRVLGPITLTHGAP